MNRTYSAVPTIRTSRHRACLRAKAVRQSSRFVFLTAFMSKSVVSPNGSGLTSIREWDRESARATLVRTPRFAGVGFLFMLFSQAIEERHFMKREISLRQGIARNIPCLTTRTHLINRDRCAKPCRASIAQQLCTAPNALAEKISGLVRCPPLNA